MSEIIDKETLKREVVKLIPEFELIKDEDLRNKTIEVWCDAMQQGGWTPEDLDNMPFTLLLDPCPASFLAHTRSVTTITYQAGQTLKKFYGDKIDINLDHLAAGGILHDVGKLLEYEKKDGKVVKSRRGKWLRHPFSGVGLGFKRGMPEEVLHMIAMHAKEGNLSPRMPAGVLVHHADFMNFEPFKK